MFDYKNKSKNKSMFHLAVLLADNPDYIKLRDLLSRHKSIETVAREEYGFSSVGDIISKSGNNKDIILNAIKKLEDIPEFHVLEIGAENPIPESLEKVKEAAPIIYASGNLSLLEEKTIGVFGTRGERGILEKKDYEAGKKVLERLLKAGFTIVSGLALGCDTLAHTYAAENNGKTIAVIATGIEDCYPKSNKGLQAIIAEKHLLVSEFPVGFLYRRDKNDWAYKNLLTKNLIKRNLTAVSISKEGIAVIKAEDGSGTMHSVRHCIEQKKPVYALENNFSDKYRNAWTRKYQVKKV